MEVPPPTHNRISVRSSRLPDRELYHVRWSLSLPVRLVQLGAIAILIDANLRIGVGRMSGVQGLWQWFHKPQPVEQNPAQGPQLDGDLAFQTAGSFQLSRYPNNLAPLLLWVFRPRMTLRFGTFTIVSALYLVVGSIHEEQRLRAADGRKYVRYSDGKPFYRPLPR